MIGNRNYSKGRGRRAGNFANYKAPVAPADQITVNSQRDTPPTQPSIPAVNGFELEGEATLRGGDLQSLWSEIDSMTKEEYPSESVPPQFSAKFLIEDEVTAKPVPLPRLMTGNLHRSNLVENRPFDQQWSAIEWSERDQWNQQSVIRSAPQPLKKSASMASLSLGLVEDPPELFYQPNISRSRSITQPLNCINTLTTIRSNEEYNGSMFPYETGPRSARVSPVLPTSCNPHKPVIISQPSPVSPVASQPTSPKANGKTYLSSGTSLGVCRYFLKGHCSRGDRCYYSHSSISGPASPVLNPSSSSAFHVPTSHSRTLTSPESDIIFSPHSRTLTSPMYPTYGNADFAVDQAPPYPSQTPSPTSPLYITTDRMVANHGHSSKSNLKPSILESQKQASKNSKRDEVALKFVNVKITEFVGQFYSLSKDQFGCRFLQKQVESHPDVVKLIFYEIFPNFIELMVDPFGNYLCQKLIEHSSAFEIGMIIKQVSPDICTVSLNMHGTRSIQTLIENTTDPLHLRLLVDNLNKDPVKLIKDLNGNHVVQKCLAKLPDHYNQFIYDAVGRHCVSIATHRHGCCVLQRCLDHAVERQRIQLVKVVAVNALALVQDPFGNYVVQYILDLDDVVCSTLVIKPFIGNICLLSTQKFSSNVIEKCIRVSSPDLRFQLIEELIDPVNLEALLRDSYANYVVQTALTYAEANQKAMLIECIRPILPQIKSTPYGKRIQTRLD